MTLAHYIYVAILGFIIGTLISQNLRLKARLKKYENKIIFTTRKELNQDIDEMLKEEI